MKLSMRSLGSISAGLAVAGSALVAIPSQATEDGPCDDLSRACILEVAYTYVHAQGGDRPRDGIRAHPDAKRWENGVNTADSAAELGAEPGNEHFYGDEDEVEPSEPSDLEAALAEAGLSTDAGIFPRYLEEWVDVESRNAFLRWTMDVTTPAGVAATAHILERIEVTDQGCLGLTPCITEIEAVFCIGYGGEEEAEPGTGVAPNMVVNFLCHRSGDRQLPRYVTAPTGPA